MTKTFTPILPGPFKYQEIYKRMEAVIRRVTEGVKRDFENTTDSWSDRPKFELRITVAPTEIAGVTWTSNMIWRLLSIGTGIHGPKHQPYIIRPTNASVLAFSEGYRAKTHPGILGSGTGGPTGGTVFATVVEHYGVEGRNWPQAAAKKYRPLLLKWGRQAMAEGARASGHGTK